MCDPVVFCLVQFAQFALLTQTLSVFGVYILQFVGSHTVNVIIVGQLVSQVTSLRGLWYHYPGPLELRLAISELWFGQEWEGILLELLGSSSIV